MNRKASFRNAYTYRTPVIKLAEKKLKRLKFLAVFLASMMLIGTLCLSPATSQLMAEVVIGSTGTILPYLTAASGSAADIQAAVNVAAAIGGGDVHIPEGTFNFVEVGEPWMAVNIPLGVNLFGAPTQRSGNDQVVEWKTVLVMPYEVPSIIDYPATFFTIQGTGASSSGVSFRFSDIKMVGYRELDPSSTTAYAGLDIKHIQNFRVDHCSFKNLAANGVGASAPADSPINGVIDHCRFVNDVGIPAPYASRTVDYGIILRRVSSQGWDNDIENVIGKHTSYTIFIENCYFSKWRHCVASNDGIHYVFRYNTIENDFGYGSLDAHGTYDYIGTRAVEVYNNVFKDAVSSPWITFIRGGGGVFFGNTIPSPGTYTLFVYLTDEGPVEKCWPRDIWIWGNTLASGVSLVSTYSDHRQTTEGVDYWILDPGPSSYPATLPGPTYAGKASITYTPYPYPHPLTY